MIDIPDYKIIFDSILVGTEAVQSLELKTGTKNPDWTVIQKPDFNINLNAFTVKKKITKALQNKKHEIIIKYAPVQANQSHVNYYLIQNLCEKDLILYVKGYSEAPLVHASIKHINFYQLQNDFKTKTIFELRNKSKWTIKYQFDIDNSQKIFEIEPETGEILPEKHVYIKAKFVSEKIGIFFLDLPCLVHFHSPIFVELFAINSPKSIEYNIKELHGQCSKISLENGFEKYMTDTFGYLNLESVCSVTPNCLDFSLKTNKIIAFPDILNQTEECVQILWDLDQEKSILVSPEKYYIRPLERSIFELKFDPKSMEKLYGGIIYGRGFIFRGNKCQEDPNTIIFSLSLRYIGNSFMKTNTWTPSCEIYPETLIMPVCLQNRSVYNTFFIKKFGDFPVVFKLLPPNKSNFYVKPMVGLITNAFQIFVVKFSSGNTKNRTFEETWKIELNQKQNSHLKIIFKAFVQEPEIIINETNEIHFGTVFLGCKKYIKASLINKTQNTIKYKFETNKWFTVKPEENVIDSYTAEEIEFCYTADCDVKEMTQIKYQMVILEEKKLIIGLSFPGYVKIFAKWAYGKLCSSPSRHDFQTLVCGVPVSTSFSLYNFSEATLHFLLGVYEHYGISEEYPVTVEPSKGSLAPGEHLEITVSVLTLWSCLATYCVQYSLMESEFSDRLVESQGNTFPTTGVVFRLDYFSFYPTIKFIEIGCNKTGPLFGKINVCEYFNIDRFNELLRTIRINETKRYRVRTPDAETGLDISKSITFIVRNVTREDAICRVERKKICNCELKEIKNSAGVASFRKYSYEDCPHRKMLFIDTTEDIVKAYKTILFKIDIHYVVSGPQEVLYLIHLSHNRTIELYFEIVGLKPAELSTYYRGFTLCMKNAYVGELNPDLQIYWFLNNTRNGAHYKIDTGPLKAYNDIWGYNVLTCVTPEGHVDAKSICSIQFLFAPIIVGNINIDLPFEFGKKNETLKILGCARNYYTSPLEQLYFTELGKDYTKLNDLLVNISTEHIVVRALPSNCTITRIFTLKNVSNERIIAYTFDNYNMEGILKAWVNPKLGFLQPGERIALILHVKSGSLACALRITIPCYLVDNTALQKHINTTANFHKQTEKRSEHFCVQEDDTITYPDVPDIIITPPPRVFHRNVAVTCHIIPQIDLDMKMTIQDQLKQTPFSSYNLYQPKKLEKYLIPRPLHTKEPPIRIGLRPKTSKKPKPREKACFGKCCLTFSDEEYVAIHTVFSCLLDDIVFSKKFKHYVTSFHKATARPYSHYKTEYLTPEEETKEAQLIINEIPKMFLSQTMQVLLADSILKHFKLGQYPFQDDYLLMRKNSTTSGKVMYTEKFLFLLDNL